MGSVRNKINAIGPIYQTMAIFANIARSDCGMERVKSKLWLKTKTFICNILKIIWIYTGFGIHTDRFKVWSMSSASDNYLLLALLVRGCLKKKSRFGVHPMYCAINIGFMENKFVLAGKIPVVIFTLSFVLLYMYVL